MVAQAPSNSHWEVEQYHNVTNSNDSVQMRFSLMFMCSSSSSIIFPLFTLNCAFPNQFSNVPRLFHFIVPGI